MFSMRSTKMSLLVLLTASLTAFGADEVASTNETIPVTTAAASVETDKKTSGTTDSASTTNAAPIQAGQSPVLSPVNSADAVVDLDKIPVRSIGSLTRDAEAKSGGLVHLRGTVLDQRTGENIVIRDDTGTIFAGTTQS